MAKAMIKIQNFSLNLADLQNTQFREVHNM